MIPFHDITEKYLPAWDEVVQLWHDQGRFWLFEYVVLGLILYVAVNFVRGRLTFVRHAICRVMGHDWQVTLINQERAVRLGNLHPLAGHQAHCLQCGEQWDDTEEDSQQATGDPEVAEVPPPPRKPKRRRRKKSEGEASSGPDRFERVLKEDEG